jgi:alanyl-tRNA synthetase
VPSNAKAGYVIRRILRRAIRYGYSYLGFTEPFMTKLVPVLAEQFDGVFPELIAQQEFVASVIREEEISFLRTLGTGLTRLDQIIGQLTTEGKSEIPGETVFELNDTFGFPADLTALVAREKGLSIDEAGFQTALQEQKLRSRKDATTSAGDWVEVGDFDGKVSFVGYDETETQSQIVKYRKVQNKQGTQYQIVIDPTPFYAESGGQIGDTGQLTVISNQPTVLPGWRSSEPAVIRVLDTKKENDLSILITDDARIEELIAGGCSLFTAKVDAHRRTLTSSNHSATHLLHSALRDVLGKHVAQKGSYVGPDALRFDFSHFTKMTDAELADVETIVNEKIRMNIQLDEKRNVPIEQAKALGATALFGEKYGDFVRVITFDPNYSVELCGGTHVPATGQIGLFKLTSEGSVSTGVRRIEAKTSEGALAMLNEQGAVLEQLKELLKAPKDVVKAVQALQDERNALLKKIEVLENEKVQQIKEQLLAKVQATNGHNTLVEQVSVPSADALKQLAYDLKAKVDNLALVLGADINGKPQLAVMLPDSLIADKGLHAGQVVKDLAKNIKGGGGGQPFFATAGGSDASGLAAALEQGRALLS